MRVPTPTCRPLPPPPIPTGKGSRTSPQKRAAVIRAVEDGDSTPTAASAGGVAKSTVNAWMHRARQHEMDGKDTWEMKFLREHEAAEGRFLAERVKRLVDLADNDWRAQAWILERRDPETWGKPVKVEHSGPDGEALATGVGTGPVVVNLIVKRDGKDDESPFTFQDRSEVVEP